LYNKIVERDKINTPNTQTHDRSTSWLYTSTSIKSGGVKLVLWTQTSPLSEMRRSCKCFPHVSTMTTLTYNRTSSVIIKNVIILRTLYIIYLIFLTQKLSYVLTRASRYKN